MHEYFKDVLITELRCSVSEIASPDNGQVFIDGSTATYTCNTGYTLVGSATRRCENSGDWLPSVQIICQSK